MAIPELWGIDPDAIYAWTPRDGRRVVEPFVFKDGKISQSAVYGEAFEGEPIVLLTPLSERLSMQLSAARTRYYIAFDRAQTKVEAGVTAEDAAEQMLDGLPAMYPEELRSAVLSACVTGWRNIKARSGKQIAFKPGEWDRNAKALPGKWLAELFNDIVNDSAWTVEDQESFLSPPGSLAG